MPLIKSASKKALDHNIEKEIESGKSKVQAIAIWLSVKKEAESKKKAKNK